MPTPKERMAEYMREYRKKRKEEGKPVPRGGKTNHKNSDPLNNPWNLKRVEPKDNTYKFLTWDIETVTSINAKIEMLERTNNQSMKSTRKGEESTVLEFVPVDELPESWATPSGKVLTFEPNEAYTWLRVKGTRSPADYFKPAWDLAGEEVVVSVCVNGIAELFDCDDLTSFFINNILIPEYNGYIIYAHNAFGFDVKRLDFARIVEAGYSAETVCGNGNSIKSITVFKDENTWTFRDTQLLLNNTLKKLANAFNTSSQKMALDFSGKSFDVTSEHDREYARMDSLVLYEIICEADRLFKESFDVSIHDKATLPGLAFQAMKQGFYEGEYFEGVSFEVAHASRLSYHGGQTLALNTREHLNELSFDANSMYVYVMKKYPLPTGKPIYKRYLPEKTNPERTLCLARVTIPEGVFPFLKTKDANGKVGNYNGVVVGWYWLFELEFQKEIGGEYDVFECYIFPDKTDAIQRFARKCEALRMQDYDGPVGMIGKLFGNSGYGKFAQVTPETTIVIQKERPALSVRDFDPRKDMNEDTVFWQVPAETRPAPDMVHWASYITAHSRLHLSRIMQAVGFENVDYCDTDSIFIEEKHVSKIPVELLGGIYGQFKKEKDMLWFKAFGKKAYEYVERPKSDNGKSPERKIANKGIPKGAIGEQVIRAEKENDGQMVHFLSTPSLFQTMEGAKLPTITHRALVRPSSLTDGYFDYRGTWIPATCEPLDYMQLKYATNTPTYPPSETKINEFVRFVNEGMDAYVIAQHAKRSKAN